MQTIKINIVNKVATAEGTPFIVCNNSDYIIKFNFDDAWAAYTTKTARFTYEHDGEPKYSEVVFTGKQCNIPVIMDTKAVEIGVYAGDILSTTRCKIPCKPSILDGEHTHDEPDEDIYNQLQEAVNETLSNMATADGTVVSPNADFAEVAEWADGNPDNEDRTGYFVCANVPVDGIVMKKATSIDDVKGVSIQAPAFAGNYSKDKLDSNGKLLPKYSFVAIIGFVPVIDNGTCTVGGRCMPDDNGCAIPSSNSMGYQVVNRIDENRVLIIIEPNGDMVQRIKTKINKLQEDLVLLSDDVLQKDYNDSIQNGVAYSGSAGKVITTSNVVTRAITPPRSYNKDVFLIPKLGYQLVIYYLDENNVVTEKAIYASNGIIIQKNKIFATMIYNNNDTSAVMTDEEVKSVITIQNEEAKEEKRRICGAFLDRKFNNIAYSNISTPKRTIINTAEHYNFAGQTDGFDAIKGDIQITIDNKLVMCHDNGFTFNSNGRITTFNKDDCTLIRNMTYDEVMNAEHATQYDGAYIHPTDIDGLLRACKRYGKFPYITIRNVDIDIIAPILIDKLREYGLETYCIINSFTLASLAEVRKYSNTVMLSQVQEKKATFYQKYIDRLNELGNVVVTLQTVDGSTIEANMDSINYAKKLGIRVFDAVFSDTNNIENLVNYGFSGVQSYVPFE